MLYSPKAGFIVQTSTYINACEFHNKLARKARPKFPSPLPRGRILGKKKTKNKKNPITELELAPHPTQVP